jgi:hypothetical protein
MSTQNDAPLNSLIDLNVGPKVEQHKKKGVGACSLTCNILGVGGVLNLWNGTRTNSQSKVQNEINLHNQGKKAISTSWMQVKWQT